MASAVDIANLALGHAGAGSIQSLTDPSVEASVCSQFLPIARDALLQTFDWAFATRRAKLSAVVLDTEIYPDFGYGYTLPADYLRPIGIVTPAGIRPIAALGDYQVEMLDSSKVMLCNQSPLVLRYGAVVDNPQLFSPLFVKALAYELGSMIVGPLRKDVSLIRALADKAFQVAVTASGVDANSGNSAERVRREYRAPWHEQR
ncbi:MAG: hypothetical protein AB7K86_08605 [Rhodospirillales bacterium]